VTRPSAFASGRVARAVATTALILPLLAGTSCIIDYDAPESAQSPCGQFQLPAELAERRLWLPNDPGRADTVALATPAAAEQGMHCDLALRPEDSAIVTVVAAGKSTTEQRFGISGRGIGSTVLDAFVGDARISALDVAITDTLTFQHSVTHRIAGVFAPENTMSAARLAARYAAPAIEFDVRLTADSVPLVIHDDDFGRTTGVETLVARTSFAAAQQLNAAAYFSASVAAEPPPALDTLLAYLARTSIPLIFAEIKHDSSFGYDVEARAVLGAARRSGLGRRLVVYSLQTAALRALRAADDSVRLGYMANAYLSTQPAFLRNNRVEYMFYPIGVFSDSNRVVLASLRQTGVQLIGYTSETVSATDAFAQAWPRDLVVADSAPSLFVRPHGQPF
jgi:glycerophosphoryl diester phosphodiesterase